MDNKSEEIESAPNADGTTNEPVNARGDDVFNSELNELKKQRATIRKNITNITRKVIKDGNNEDTTILQCRLEILETYFKQICHIQGKLETMCPSDTARSDLEEQFIMAKSKLLGLINGRRVSVADHTFLNQSMMGPVISSKLPSLKLPRFDGKYSEYQRFMSSFKNMVHDNTSISLMDKFNYLINCLSGPALAVVEPYQVTEENYPAALKRLQDRYDNKVLIFLEHISALFNVPNMTKGDSVTLRSIIDTVAGVRGSLLSLGTELEILNGLIIHIVLSKLDADTKENYDEKQNFKSLPSWDSCYEMLSHRCQFLESHNKKSDNDLEKPRSTKSKSNFIRSSNTFVNSNSNCSYCNSTEHNISTCTSFSSLNVPERFNYIKRNGHCINCLRKGHVVSRCASSSKCRICNSSHHTLLHIFSKNGSQTSSFSSSSVGQHSPVPIHSTSTSLLVRSIKRAIIPTAIVLVKDSCGNFQPVRTLLDSCSEINFISEEVAKRLRLKMQPFSQEISGIGEVRTKIRSAVSATIKSRVCSYQWSSRFLVTKSISAHQPGENICISKWKVPENIELADPLFYKPQHIDMLISSEVFFDLLLEGQIKLGEGLPCLTNTVFGWIVGGSYPGSSTALVSCNLATNNATSNIDSTLKLFWEIEEYSQNSSRFTFQEEACEEHYMKYTTFDEHNRVKVRLPFKKSPDLLGNSFNMAKRRFLSLERRLDRDPTLKSMYMKFMDEYQSLGHMSIFNGSLSSSHYVIPHHCVLKPESTTTKLRVVFDGSARTTSNLSLNDTLMVGPTIQQDLITTLFSFRLHKIALTADISKMYRQFRIHKDDTKYQLILWRTNKDEDLKVFQLDTVTYGLSSAPFLAIRSLFFIAEKHNSEYPYGSQVLKNDLYVDDVLTGAEDISTLLIMKMELLKILNSHGLELAKWHSNASEIGENSNEEIIIKTSEEDVTKALGMSWKPHKDIFCYRFELHEIINPTKRSILSLVAKIYDLLGLLSPIVIRCKILLQEIWMQNLEWDVPIIGKLKNTWDQISSDLPFISKIEIPRYVFSTQHFRGEIHGFADASQRAYGCCIYYRIYLNGSYKITLLMAKSKVAPIKVQSLPRLELCAALLLSRTWEKIKSKMMKFVSFIYFWTDSSIVLQWLKLHSSTLNCFVANRISELQEKSHGISWRHVPTKFNPADIVSRGCSAKDLKNTIWFSGPTFLQEHQSKWPSTTGKISEIVLEQRNKSMVTCNPVPTSLIDEIINKHSSFYKLIRVFSYIFRFFNRCPSNRCQNHLDILEIPPKELDRTFWRIVSHIQGLNYKDEIYAITKGKIIQPSLQKLTPFIHDNGHVQILRVGGRLSNAPIPYDAKFPALLPKSHRFLKLYIEYLHHLHKHAGAKVLLGIMRQKIWVINGREIVRKVVRNCIHCYRYKPKLMDQIMGDLPADRLRSLRPFLISGVDFCGPFFTTYRIRGKPPYKTYIAVFVCFSSKATHLELVSDLSTNNFLLCLKRFVARRGIPQRLYCDNATNFVGCHNKLKELKDVFFKKEVIHHMTSYASQIGFEFCFIPPRAPHFGGLWEAAVKSAKTLLVKNLASSHLTFEELQTLIIEIEAILNSRPIAPLSDDPNDGEALTPGHLLVGSSLLALPDETFNTTKPGMLNQWQRISFLKQQFWTSWSRDYLLSLQQRTKWSTIKPNLINGQLVLIHEDNIPPQQWLLARIKRCLPGKDGKVRVVELTTKNGQYCRPIHKIALLPSQNDD